MSVTEPRMTPLERVAALLLVSALGGVMLNRESPPRYDPVRASADELGCDRVQTCLAVEHNQLSELRRLVVARDLEAVPAAEARWLQTRRLLARFGPEEDVHYDDELGSHDVRADALDALANAYAALSAEERAATSHAP